MEWWVAVQDLEEDYIPIKLDENLLEEVSNNTEYINEDGENIVLNSIKDIREYFSFCFQDEDFLPDSLDLMVKLYLDNPLFAELFLDVNLDDYITLMSADMRELYLEKRGENEGTSINQVKWSEEVIIKELYNSLKLLSEHVVEIRDKSEVEISNEIFRMVKRLFKLYFGIEVERESEIGHSNKKLGENDFYLYDNGNEYVNIAIGENKILNEFKYAYGQLLGYLNINFKFGFTISISKDKSIREAYQYIIRQLRNIKYDGFDIKTIDEEPYGENFKYLIKTVHTLPEDKSREMNLYHLILDLNDEHRKAVAKATRDKKALKKGILNKLM